MKRKKIRNDNTKKLLIWILASGGLVVLSVLAPQLPYELLKGYLRHRSKLQNRLNQLEKQGWIKVEKNADEIIVKLVKKGKLQAIKYQMDNLKIEKPERWDGKWRIVIFDIPNKKRVARDVLRQKLKEMDFYLLQESVFIQPYPCEKEIEIIKSVYEIWPYVNLIVAEKIDNENKLKNKFSLE
jgi:CRISPR-associated endonuclease Cas2